VAGAGLPEFVTERRPLGPTDLVLLHPGGPAQSPWWLLVPLLIVSVVGVTRRRLAPIARLGLLLFGVGVGAALLVSRLQDALPGVPSIRYWTGAPLAVGSVGALMAAVVAADRARPALRTRAFGWRQPAAVLVGAALAVSTGWLVVAQVSRGADKPVAANDSRFLPVFAAAEIGRTTSPRVIALRSTADAVRFTLLRDAAGPRLGDADVDEPGADTAAAQQLRQAVQEAAAGQSAAIPQLVGFGVTMLVVPSTEADGLSRLADVDGLDRVPSTGAVVWRTGPPAGELVVLPPDAAAEAVRGEAVGAAGTRPLRAGEGHADTDVPAGAAGRLLVLAEPADGEWRASLDGRDLSSVRAYGWAQAWRLPAAGGHLDVHRASTARPWWLAIELALLVALVVAALPGRRADDEPAPAGAA
jgi:hypothetical protein